MSLVAIVGSDHARRVLLATLSFSQQGIYSRAMQTHPRVLQLVAISGDDEEVYARGQIVVLSAAGALRRCYNFETRVLQVCDYVCVPRVGEMAPCADAGKGSNTISEARSRGPASITSGLTLNVWADMHRRRSPASILCS